ncbi:MAG TPA: valine--tRNA ligase [Firmicutes bacterium]|nr:valine--tRNA ligase [Bacillota bacterium]
MKNVSDLPKTYDPQAVEKRWYDFWLEGRYFHAEPNPKKKPYCIVIPPPNVTGQLHLGHAWDNTNQDILIRYHRMAGYETLWLPGTDHAGIATQVKVEEKLAEEGKTKYDLGREKFLERVWAWKEEYGGRILHQLQRLGASCDWDRTRFTLDEGCSRAVREVFVRLYRKGLIYRGDRIINYCPKCHTTLSDIEVEHKEREGRLWRLRYPFKEGDGYVEVATTRPETMLGDTAVAVHPDDERYNGLVGRTVILPLLGREIPIVADEYVDPQFGTGAVKVTPAHDPNDFEIGRRHNLPSILVIGTDGRMTGAAGRFAGLDRYEARKAVVAALKEQGVLVGEEHHRHAVGQCYRCDTVVEPLLSKQWFVKMQPLAEPAIAAVKEGRTRFVPKRFTKLYLHWLENIRDWCISRQLWWGHRIPVWYCRDCGEVVCQETDPDRCPRCGGELEQDPDVLDTWFSSALWPFSTLGWPDKTPELAYFYPTSALCTGFDIIFFWVARMMMMGLEFMGEVPFRDVFIHGLIRDAQGRKMSKSLGNGVDPLEVIDRYGADALRFTLATGVAPGYDQRFRFERVEAARNFANKLWNAARFALLNLEGFEAPAKELTAKDLKGLALALPDRWILSRYAAVAQRVAQKLDRYDLGEAGKTLYDFIWSEFCDWYLELAKPRLYGKQGEEERKVAQTVLWYVLEGTLRLLHPFMPFVTEEIWQSLPHRGEALIAAPWPKAPRALHDAAAEREMHLVTEVVRVIRNLKAEHKVEPGKAVPALVRGGQEALAALEAMRPLLVPLARLTELTLLPAEEEAPQQAVTAVAAGVEVFLPLAGLVDVTKERPRLAKERAEAAAEVERLRAKLANPGFTERAPAEVVAKERAKLVAAEERLALAEAHLAELDRLAGA